MFKEDPAALDWDFVIFTIPLTDEIGQAHTG